jgi:exopolyphosphatase / guanosine-5'-triphosphate,3'-diphosphate pyrophosphatase
VTDADHPIAALDVGSNTVRLVVARLCGESIETVTDLSAFVRLGSGVDSSGKLDPVRQLLAINAVAEFAEAAKQAGAHDIIAVATSAVRDAQNGQSFVDTVHKDTGVDVQIISGEREAQLTYLGATLGLPSTGSSIVVDLGGGSGELIAASSGDIAWAESLPIGGSRLTERFVHHDPPLPDELEAVKTYVGELLKALPPHDPDHAVMTGGTARRVPALAGKGATDTALRRADLAAAVDTLLREPAARITEQYGIEPERAGVLPAGVAALLAIIDFYTVERVTITLNGIRQGMIVDRLQQQGRWPK